MGGDIGEIYKYINHYAVVTKASSKIILLIVQVVYIIFALPDYSSEVIERHQKLFYGRLIPLALEFDTWYTLTTGENRFKGKIGRNFYPRSGATSSSARLLCLPCSSSAGVNRRVVVVSPTGRSIGLLDCILCTVLCTVSFSRSTRTSLFIFF